MLEPNWSSKLSRAMAASIKAMAREANKWRHGNLRKMAIKITKNVCRAKNDGPSPRSTPRLQARLICKGVQELRKTFKYLSKCFI